MAIHAASLKTSERLQKVYAVLKDGKWHTTKELHRPDEDLAVHTTISELKAPINNIKIETESAGVINGRSVYKYRLEPQPKQPQHMVDQQCPICGSWYRFADGRCNNQCRCA
jgi:hypothetical protein